MQLASHFASRTGTLKDPWIIKTAQHLNNVRNYTGIENRPKYFELANDIDLGQSPWNEEAGWEPIGETEMTAFTGGFDGQVYKIQSLYMNRPQEDNIGLKQNIKKL